MGGLCFLFLPLFLSYWESPNTSSMHSRLLKMVWRLPPVTANTDAGDGEPYYPGFVELIIQYHKVSTRVSWTAAVCLTTVK